MATPPLVEGLPTHEGLFVIELGERLARTAGMGVKASGFPLKDGMRLTIRCLLFSLGAALYAAHETQEERLETLAMVKRLLDESVARMPGYDAESPFRGGRSGR